MSKFSVLFICTGNICRSPTFEGVFRHIISEQNISEKLIVDSAGTHNYHVGEQVDKRSIFYAKKRGYDLSMITSRQVTKKDFIKFDLILPLDEDHLSSLNVISPKDFKDKIKLFLPYISYKSYKNVPDPYYGKAKDFELVLDLAESALIKLIYKIKALL